jgi:oligopeptide/dipeptide ABC transporter ATP-binding protein
MQAQILDLMQHLQAEMGMAIMLITHNLGVVAEVCDEVAVMYLGQVVEQSTVDELFNHPMHPYTQALLRSIPRLGHSRDQRLDSIRGMVPDPYNRPTGCPFHTRCDKMIAGRCDTQEPPLTAMPDGHIVSCWLYL